MNYRLKGRDKAFVALALIAAGVGASYIVPSEQRAAVVASSYLAQACPALSTAGTNVASLPSKKLGIRYLDGKSLTATPTSLTQIPLGKNAVLVDSNPGNSLLFSSLASVGVAAIGCSAGNPDEWFIGGSGGLTSKGQLELVNSGLGESIVDIYPFTSKQALAKVSVQVKANSSATVALDALAPGEDSMALHVVTRTGKVSTFVLDQRAKGLAQLGLDYVKPIDAPQTHLVISGLYPHSGSKSSITTSLRLLAPGSLDANVHVQVVSSDGSFIPVGFDGYQLQHGSVVTIPLTNLTTSSAFGLVIDSDQPILASALTTAGSHDFAWAGVDSPLTRSAFNFGGNAPILTLVGQSISVRISGRLISGKSFNQTVSGSDFATWAPKSGVTSIQLSPASRSPIYVGAIFTGGGLTYLPISVNATLTNTTLPFNDVHTLTH
jgi:Family of unknown function (DUF5719)